MSSGMSSKTCYAKLNFDFPYVRSLLLRLDPDTGMMIEKPFSLLTYAHDYCQCLLDSSLDYLDGIATVHRHSEKR